MTLTYDQSGHAYESGPCPTAACELNPCTGKCKMRRPDLDRVDPDKEREAEAIAKANGITAAPVAQAEPVAQGEPMRSAPYNPTPAMIDAARHIDPALRLEDIRALWAVMWTAATAAPVAPDWQHLKQYGYAPGNYMNRCHHCNVVVPDVDKRAITCRPCAEKLHAEATAPAASVAQPAAPRAPLTDEQIGDVARSCYLDITDSTKESVQAFGVAVMVACAEAWGVKLEGGAA